MNQDSKKPANLFIQLAKEKAAARKTSDREASRSNRRRPVSEPSQALRGVRNGQGKP
jgi:hypothetical protein